MFDPWVRKIPLEKLKLEFFGTNTRNIRSCYGPISSPHVPFFLVMLMANDGAELVKFLISFQKGEKSSFQRKNIFSNK